MWSLRGAAILSQLETLLDRAPRLYSLSVDEGFSSVLAQLKISNGSIRRVRLKQLLTEDQSDSTRYILFDVGEFTTRVVNAKFL